MPLKFIAIGYMNLHTAAGGGIGYVQGAFMVVVYIVQANNFFDKCNAFAGGGQVAKGVGGGMARTGIGNGNKQLLRLLL